LCQLSNECYAFSTIDLNLIEYYCTEGCQYATYQDAKVKWKKKIQLAIHQHSANNGEVKIFKNFYPQSLSPVFCVICMLHCVCVLLMQQNTHSKRIDVLSAKINFSPFISTTVLCDSDHRQIQGARSVLLSRTTSLVWKQVAQSFLICEWFA